MKEVILITGATSDLAFEYLNLIKNQEKIIIAFYYDLNQLYASNFHHVCCSFNS